MVRLSVRSVAVLTTLTALVATSALVGCMPATAADVRVRHALFGMHDGSGGTLSLDQVDAGAVRLWDVGVQWQQVETHENGHKYDWTRLDQLVAAAQSSHAEVTMVVGMTPRFYASSPLRPPRHISAYKDFVRAMMRRYKSFNGQRGIAAYQVWNEGNIETFWKGTAAQLAHLTKAMHDVRDKVDKHALVIAPSMVTRLPYQMKGLSKYYQQRVGGKRVWKYVDAVALSLYPLPRFGGRTGVPEDTIKQLRAVKRRLHKAGAPRSKKIWNTEVNYGLQTGSKAGTAAAPIPATRQAANVVRTYLLNAANGVKRVFWYRYDFGRLSGGGLLANTLLTDPDDVTSLTAAGAAYSRVQNWMRGTLVASKGHRPCRTDRHGTYKCVVKDSSGKRYIYWNPFKVAKVKLPQGVHESVGVLGGTSSVKPRSTLKVGYKPVMVH